MEWFIKIFKKPRGVSTLYTDNEQAFEATITNWYFDNVFKKNPLEQMTAKLER